MITDYMRQIAYNEGYKAFTDGIKAFTDGVDCRDNPYAGNSDELYYMWDDGWLDAFYGSIKTIDFC